MPLYICQSSPKIPLGLHTNNQTLKIAPIQQNLQTLKHSASTTHCLSIPQNITPKDRKTHTDLELALEGEEIQPIYIQCSLCSTEATFINLAQLLIEETPNGNYTYLLGVIHAPSNDYWLQYKKIIDHNLNNPEAIHTNLVNALQAEKDKQHQPATTNSMHQASPPPLCSLTELSNVLSTYLGCAIKDKLSLMTQDVCAIILQSNLQYVFNLWITIKQQSSSLPLISNATVQPISEQHPPLFMHKPDNPLMQQEDQTSTYYNPLSFNLNNTQAIQQDTASSSKDMAQKNLIAKEKCINNHIPITISKLTHLPLSSSPQPLLMQFRASPKKYQLMHFRVHPKKPIPIIKHQPIPVWHKPTIKPIQQDSLPTHASHIPQKESIAFNNYPIYTCPNCKEYKLIINSIIETPVEFNDTTMKLNKIMEACEKKNQIKHKIFVTITYDNNGVISAIHNKQLIEMKITAVNEDKLSSCIKSIKSHQEIGLATTMDLLQNIVKNYSSIQPSPNFLKLYISKIPSKELPLAEINLKILIGIILAEKISETIKKHFASSESDSIPLSAIDTLPKNTLLNLYNASKHFKNKKSLSTLLNLIYIAQNSDNIVTSIACPLPLPNNQYLTLSLALPTSTEVTKLCFTEIAKSDHIFTREKNLKVGGSDLIKALKLLKDELRWNPTEHQAFDNILYVPCIKYSTYSTANKAVEAIDFTNAEFSIIAISTEFIDSWNRLIFSLSHASIQSFIPEIVDFLTPLPPPQKLHFYASNNSELQLIINEKRPTLQPYLQIITGIRLAEKIYTYCSMNVAEIKQSKTYFHVESMKNVSKALLNDTFNDLLDTSKYMNICTLKFHITQRYTNFFLTIFTQTYQLPSRSNSDHLEELRQTTAKRPRNAEFSSFLESLPKKLAV